LTFVYAYRAIDHPKRLVVMWVPVAREAFATPAGGQKHVEVRPPDDRLVRPSRPSFKRPRRKLRDYAALKVVDHVLHFCTRLVEALYSSF
jgi:hypothetical protein